MIFTFGNRCGHKKDEFRQYSSPAHYKNRPKLVEKLLNGLQSFAKYPGRIPQLQHLRSERREAISLVSGCLIDHYDMGSDKVIPITIERIVELTEIGFKRAWRAIKDLKRVGFLFIQRQFTQDKQNKDRFIGLVSLKTLSFSFLKALGINWYSVLKFRRYRTNERRVKKIEEHSIQKANQMMEEYHSRSKREEVPKSTQTFKNPTEFCDNLWRLLGRAPPTRA